MSEISTFVETWDTLLKHFCSRDDYRANMCTPNIVGEYLYATDTHAWLKVPYQPSFRKYKNELKAPDFEGAMKGWKYVDPILITKASINKVLTNFELKPDWKICKECHGEGSKECKCCGTDLDCMNCEGIGHIDDCTVPEVYDNGPESEFAIKIMDNLVAPFQLGRLARAMDFIKADSILLHTLEKYKGMVFRHGDIEIVVMPLISEDIKYDKVVKLEI